MGEVIHGSQSNVCPRSSRVGWARPTNPYMAFGGNTRPRYPCHLSLRGLQGPGPTQWQTLQYEMQQRRWAEPTLLHYHTYLQSCASCRKVYTLMCTLWHCTRLCSPTSAASVRDPGMNAIPRIRKGFTSLVKSVTIMESDEWRLSSRAGGWRRFSTQTES